MPKYLKGFSNLGYLPVVENTTSAYNVSKIVKLPSAKSCAPTDNKKDFAIPADDGIYDSGADWEDTTLVITIHEASLNSLAELTGAKFDKNEEEMEEGTFDNAPEVALTYSALRRDGGYRLYRYYSCTCTGYKITHTTKGEDNNSQTYELTFKCKGRKYNNKIRTTKDVAKDKPLSWLDTIPPVSADDETLPDTDAE